MNSNFTKRKENFPAFVIEHGRRIIDENEEKANELASRFTSFSPNLSETFKKRKSLIENQILNIDAERKYEAVNEPFILEELVSAVNMMKNSTPGPDMICQPMITHLPDCALRFLLNVLNMIWETSTFPKGWTHSLIIPILKRNEDPSNPGSYRPISLTSIMCKLMERMVNSRLTWILEKFSIISPLQNGFRKNRSTMDPIVQLENDIQKGLGNKEATIVCFLDFEKAYDSLYRNAIIYKMQLLGFHGKMITWVESFFTNRTIQVRVGNSFSNVLHLDYGVPQGSVISPTLFNIMLNDLSEIQNTFGVNMSFYADDVALWFSNRNVKYGQKKIQKAMDSVEHWCDTWGMTLSTRKSCVVVFTYKKINETPIRISLAGDILRVESSFKYLGMWFDQKNTWKKHIEDVINKCKVRMNILRVLTGTDWGADTATLLMVYRGLIRSKIDYGCTVYDSAPKYMKDKLDSIQYKCLRIITGAPIATSLDALQMECNEMPLDLRRQYFIDSLQIHILNQNNDHPLKQLLRPCWQYERLTQEQRRNVMATRFSTLDSNVEPFMAIYVGMPFWHLASPTISFTIKDQFAN